MDFKRLVLWSVIWTAAVIGLSAFGLWYIMSHPVPGASAEARSGRLGQGMAYVATIGYAVIWLPAAFRYGQKRREREARRSKGRRRR